MKLLPRLIIVTTAVALITAAAVGGLIGWRGSAADVALSSALGALVAILVTLPLVVLFVRSLTAPLAQLTGAIQHFRAGEGSISLPAASGELGALLRAFESMAVGVQAKFVALAHESQERKRLFETTLDLILVTDRQGNLVRVSPSSAAILGYQPEEMIGHSAAEFIYSPDLDPTRAEMRMARRGKLTRNFETRYLHKDGSIVSLAWTGVWVESEQKHFFIGRDISQQKRLQETQRVANETLRAVIDASPVAIICLRAEDRAVLVWSRAAEQIFGYSAEETVGRPYMLVPEGRDAEYDDLTARAFRGEILRNIKVQRRHKDGRLMDINFDAAPMYDSGRIRAVAYALVDVTERNKLDRELLHAQKQEAIGHLTGGVAHDFNNILTVIIGNIEILAELLADHPQATAIVKMVDDAAERGADLTRQLLAFSRKQPLEPRQIDINELLMQSAQLLRPSLGENIEIASTLEDELWPALIDPGQLKTAVINLAINARDAMPEGGKLTLETDNVYLDETYAARHTEVKPGPYVLLAVSDTGSGIPAAIRDKVFEPFFTTKPIGQGTGLGLSMVFGFIKQSGGHINIYSEEGQGTTVKLYLPQAGEYADALASFLPAVPLQGGRDSILVVEDDPLVRAYVVTQFVSLGYATVAAANATEALDIIDQGREVDLLFTDVVIAGTMNGRQLAAEVLRRRPSIKVLYTSGYTESAIVHHGRLDPGVLLLPKPYRKADLARMVRIALAQSQSQAAAPAA